MADSPKLPGQQGWKLLPPTKPGGLPELPVEFFRFFRDLLAFLSATDSNTEEIASLREQLAELFARTYNLAGADSVQVLGLLKDGATVRLLNDELNPLPVSFYATDEAQQKGWQILEPDWIPSPHAEYPVDENGNYLRDENGNIFVSDPMAQAYDVRMARLPGSTYSTLQESFNVMNSPGLITGGTFTDLGSGNLGVSAGTCTIRSINDDVSTLYLADFPAAVLSIANDSLTKFIGVERNGGHPQIIQKDVNTWDMDTEFPLGIVANLGGTLFPFYNPFKVGDPITNIIQRFDAQASIIRDSSGGLMLGNSATRNATLTSGIAWARLNDYTITSKSSGTNLLIPIRPNPAAPPPLLFDTPVTQWPNTQYLSGTTLTTMTNNRWANLWFFVNIGSNAWGFAYGTAEYLNSSAAAAEQIPSYLTTNFLSNNLLVGRMIFEKNNDTPIVESAFTRVFSTTPVSDHNQLSSLQGGTTGEYYHFTAAEHTSLLVWAGEDPANFDPVGSAASALASANAYTDSVVSSGTWTPTLTNTTNLTASTSGVGQWSRIGDVVTFSVRVAAQATSGSAGTPVATLLGVSLPVATDLTAANQVAGNATIGEAPYVPGQVSSDTTNDRFSLNWFATSTTNRAITISGTYRMTA